MTKNQWTPEFRKRRKEAYNKTYLRKGIGLLHDLYLQTGRIDENQYNLKRRDLKDNSFLRFSTVRDRFFEGDQERLNEAVIHFNHRVKKVQPLDQKIDVYDLEVPETHNFALAAGIFVHNSAKQGRDRRFQAILPLRGKILNVEKSRLEKVLANEEIRTMITAVGTGIGMGAEGDGFDLGKLRYHKVIIMTDADVDGSHIRTLLLTFFYRQMRQLIERGHVYIAQPPLYKIKKGKREEYVQTEERISQILLELGLEGAKLKNLKAKQTYEDKDIKTLLETVLEVDRARHSMQRKGVDFGRYLAAYDAKQKLFPEYLARMAAGNGKEKEDEQFLYSDDELAKLVKTKEKEKGKALSVETKTGGGKPAEAAKETLEVVELFEAHELVKIAKKLEKFDLTVQSFAEGEGALFELTTGKKTRTLKNLSEVLEALKETGKEGMDFQRYKGLGEMNPSQLWETTMDPAKRTILKVTLEDAVEADQMFTILMGDQVEPRRQFIERNAKAVRNLDI